MAHQWLPQFTHRNIHIQQEKIVFSNYSQIKEYKLQFQLFGGGQSGLIQREVFCRPPAVAVLLWDPEARKLVLIEQLRMGALNEKESPWILEIVAGVVDPGEAPEQAAIRETLEETGCKIESLLPVCDYLVSPGVSDEKIIVYCGKIKAPTIAGHFGLVEQGEDIQLQIMSVEEAFSLLDQGKIVSSPALIALQWFRLNLSSLHFPRENE